MSLLAFHSSQWSKRSVYALKKEIYEVNSEGFIINNFMGEFDNSGELVKPVGDYVTVRLPQPLYFYKAKFDGTQWIDGETEEEKAERESQQLLESLKPSPSEIANAEIEIKILTTLTELGVIQ